RRHRACPGSRPPSEVSTHDDASAASRPWRDRLESCRNAPMVGGLWFLFALGATGLHVETDTPDALCPPLEPVRQAVRSRLRSEGGPGLAPGRAHRPRFPHTTTRAPPLARGGTGWSLVGTHRWSGASGFSSPWEQPACTSRRTRRTRSVHRSNPCGKPYAHV